MKTTVYKCHIKTLFLIYKTIPAFISKWEKYYTSSPCSLKYEIFFIKVQNRQYFEEHVLSTDDNLVWKVA